MDFWQRMGFAAFGLVIVVRYRSSITKFNIEGAERMRLAPSPKTFASGAALVWRWQRILWWIFIINLVLAYWATKGMAERADWALSHSVPSEGLVNGFDLFSLAELAGQPDTPIEQPGPAVFHYS